MRPWGAGVGPSRRPRRGVLAARLVPMVGRVDAVLAVLCRAVWDEGRGDCGVSAPGQEVHAAAVRVRVRAARKRPCSSVRALAAVLPETPVWVSRPCVCGIEEGRSASDLGARPALGCLLSRWLS